MVSMIGLVGLPFSNGRAESTWRGKARLGTGHQRHYL